MDEPPEDSSVVGGCSDVVVVVVVVARIPEPAGLPPLGVDPTMLPTRSHSLARTVPQVSVTGFSFNVTTCPPGNVTRNSTFF